VEVAGYFLLGQGLLALLAGSRRHDSTMYKLFLIVTGPVVKAVRKLTPRQIIDKHVPFIAFAVLFWLWIALAWLKRLYCETNLLQCS
ncbi:MAG: hypothetical protein D4R84_14945, partial [Rhodocyclaceae bacterium]